MVLKIDRPLSGNDSAIVLLYFTYSEHGEKGQAPSRRNITFKQSRKIWLLIIQEELPRVLCMIWRSTPSG